MKFEKTKIPRYKLLFIEAKPYLLDIDEKRYYYVKSSALLNEKYNFFRLSDKEARSLRYISVPKRNINFAFLFFLTLPFARFLSKSFTELENKFNFSITEKFVILLITFFLIYGIRKAYSFWCLKRLEKILNTSKIRPNGIIYADKTEKNRYMDFRKKEHIICDLPITILCLFYLFYSFSILPLVSLILFARSYLNLLSANVPKDAQFVYEFTDV
ncbi:hypothetical protein [Floricoccus penangensis]|uniref:hypothetical protein n=1 Tax=Floricoccus penangensis TaxID=1859475 RepID=UPI00203B68A6|nr:hypothetical protein [Floricoccus penangensis]URZ88142.1 hypothetical protein KIW23_03665 [Floricoccus penangensis]